MSLISPIVIGIFSLYAIYMLYFLTGLFRLKQQARFQSVNEPFVSVVIAARNEEENIGALLNDLESQTYDQNKIEIVIADDRSTDKTWDIINSFLEKHPNISGIKITDKSETMTPKKHALTQAIQQTKGEIIISTDADCRVKPNWVKSTIQQFDDETGIVIGYSKVDADLSIFKNYQLVDFLALMSANAGSLGWGNAWTGSGQNIAYKKTTFEKISGFKPVADQVSGDDFYLTQAISNISKARYNSNLDGFVTTKPMESIWSFLSQRTRWASNTRNLFNSDFFFLLFLFLNLFVNTILLGGIFIRSVWEYLPMLLGIKFLFDSMVIFYASYIFKTDIKLPVYLLWSLIQPFYTPVLAVVSMIGKYRWKN